MKVMENKLKEEAGKLPVLDAKMTSFIVFVLIACLYLLTSAVSRSPLFFWGCYAIIFLAFLMGDIMKWGIQNAVKVLLWFLSAFVPIGLKGASMLYDIPVLNTIVNVVMLVLAVFVVVCSAVLLFKKRLFNTSSLASFFLLIDLVVLILMLMIE